MEEKLKKFKVKASLIDLKTKKDIGSRELIAIGTCGNNAIYNLRNELKKEGLYDLGENYNYFEIGQA